MCSATYVSPLSHERQPRSTGAKAEKSQQSRFIGEKSGEADRAGAGGDEMATLSKDSVRLDILIDKKGQGCQILKLPARCQFYMFDSLKTGMP